jgi:hypothetical protein
MEFLEFLEFLALAPRRAARPPGRRGALARPGLGAPEPALVREASLTASLRLVRWTRAGRAFRPTTLRASILFLDAGIDLFAMDLDFRWGVDAELDLSGSHLEHGDLDRITDPNVLP